MENDSARGVGGWLLVYLIASIPPLIVYSMGLSGWFFDYPLPLMAAIFCALAVPLALILVKSPKAPRWNIRMLWLIVVLMILRSVSVFLFPMADEGQPPMSGEEARGVVAILAAIVAFALAWAAVWTRYFRQSVRVARTFS